jgi:aminomethyltransferase
MASKMRSAPVLRVTLMRCPRPAKRGIVTSCQAQVQRQSQIPLGRGSTEVFASRPRVASLQRNVFRNYATSSDSKLKTTPLYDAHIEAGAKMVPFAGYDMPLEYSGQSHTESHKWVREKAGLFDVSHMLQHKISGDLAEEFMMKITPAPLLSLPKFSSTLSCLLQDPSGGIVDDTVITRIGTKPSAFYFVTNAGCREEDLAFIQKEMDEFLTSKKADKEKIKWHVLDHHALLALQGPQAKDTLQKIVYRDEEDDDGSWDLSTLYFGNARWLQLVMHDATNTPSMLISRTGYTGEDGFEISIPPENGDPSALAKLIAETLLKDEAIVRWAGLAARDSLRLEAGMCLYGHDLNLETTPPMAALGWVVGKDRRDRDSAAFNGASKILEQLASPKSMASRRVGFEVEKGPAAREGSNIIDVESGEVLGKITSGLPSPTLGGQNIAMGYIKNGYHKRGTKVGIKIRKRVSKAEVVKMPFVENKFYRESLKEKA